MSTKGEKRGFSGGMEHWVVCKVLKRNEYGCPESVGADVLVCPYGISAIRELEWCIMTVFCGVPPCDCILDRNRRCRKRQESEAACAVSRTQQAPRTPPPSWFCGHPDAGLHRSADHPKLGSSPVNSRTPKSHRNKSFFASFAVSSANFAVKIFNRKGRKGLNSLRSSCTSRAHPRAR